MFIMSYINEFTKASSPSEPVSPIFFTLKRENNKKMKTNNNSEQLTS